VGRRSFVLQTFNCHVSYKGGVTRKKKKRKVVQHAKKTRMPKSSRKVKGLKGKKKKEP